MAGGQSAPNYAELRTCTGQGRQRLGICGTLFLLFTDSELPTLLYRADFGVKMHEMYIFHSVGSLAGALPIFADLPTFYTMDDVLFNNYHEMGNFPQKERPCGLFQWAGLAYFTHLPLSVKRRATWEWGLKCHE
jgi:hypothetical protein